MKVDKKIYAQVFWTLWYFELPVFLDVIKSLTYYTKTFQWSASFICGISTFILWENSCTFFTCYAIWCVVRKLPTTTEAWLTLRDNFSNGLNAITVCTVLWVSELWQWNFRTQDAGKHNYRSVDVSTHHWQEEGYGWDLMYCWSRLHNLPSTHTLNSINTHTHSTACFINCGTVSLHFPVFCSPILL